MKYRVKLSKIIMPDPKISDVSGKLNQTRREANKRALPEK